MILVSLVYALEIQSSDLAGSLEAERTVGVDHTLVFEGVSVNLDLTFVHHVDVGVALAPAVHELTQR